MIDIEPRIRAELDERVAPFAPDAMDWQNVLRRAGEPQRRQRRRLTALAVAGLLLSTLAITPLGAALADRIGGFSEWLAGTPGEPAAPLAQRLFDRANERSGARFPDNPRLKELLRLDVDGRSFFLYGFETREVVCLRVAVRRVEGAGPQAACVSRADLRRSGDLVLPVKANMSVGRVGPLPRDADDPPTVSKYLLTFGLAAAEVSRVTVTSDAGTSAAVVRNGAFLHVLRPERRGVWARSVTAVADGGRTDAVPISVQVAGQPALATGMRPHGPASVEREVTGGHIGWFDRREPRGVSAAEAGLRTRVRGFARVVYPDPNDFIGVAVGDRRLLPGPRSPLFPRGDDVICFGTVSRGGFGGGCAERERLFRASPLAISWGFSGGGQQIWLVSGLASDDVARIEVFLGDGRHWTAPLRDNATAFRVQRAKFPVRVVAYDRAGLVIEVRTISGG